MKTQKLNASILKLLVVSVFILFACNFSFAQTNNAFGNNMKTMDSTEVSPGVYTYIFAIYSGDINQDGAVDGSDFLELDPSIQNGDGGYMPGDLNGDGAVDGSDFLVLDPNIQGGIGSATP